MKPYQPTQSPSHGGALNAAVRKYQIPLSDWLDLSTGINPNGWQVKESIPVKAFQRLPEEDDGLLNAAASYYGSDNCIAVAGTQAAIQILPALREKSRVGVLSPGYEEHAWSWNRHGHEVVLLQPEEIDSVISELDVLVVINPNNPTCHTFTRGLLLQWHEILAARGGWLVVDEAFADALDDHTLLPYSFNAGLIILRSIGKFFGLAGIRVGFIFSDATLLTKIKTLIGPWSVSHPSRLIATEALKDKQWQVRAREDLKWHSQRLVSLLENHRLTPSGSCCLFQWVVNEKAALWYRELACRGILIRYFSEPESMRFGLPANELELQRLEHALACAGKRIEEAQCPSV